MLQPNNCYFPSTSTLIAFWISDIGPSDSSIRRCDNVCGIVNLIT